MMQAMVLTAPGTAEPLQFQDRPVPAPGPGEAVVRLHAAALNHRDLYLVQGRSAAGTPFVPGSDGAGEVAALGDGVTGWRPGDAVVVNATLYCGRCRWCLAGEHSLCDSFEILGGPRDGTFAQYLRIPAGNLAPMPPHLDHAQAAALPLALGTAWRALLTRARLQPGETVLVHGIGGGVALYCLQIATALGARVLVTSASDAKLARAAELGAAAGINYATEDVATRVLALTGGAGADLSVDTAGARTLPISLAAVRKGGRIVQIGATTGQEVALTARDIYWRQVSLIGSTMNTQAEFDAAIRFVTHTRLQPTVSAVFPLADAPAAFAEMAAAAQFGKLILRLP